MRSLLFATVISIAVAGCYADGTTDGPVGSAVARITQVPPMVGCIAITVVGSRNVTDRFNVSPGQPATLTLKNLPVGNDSFTAAAFDAACNAIGGAQPSWSSTAPFAATVNQGSVTSLVLTLEPTGGATIGINFDTDGGGGGPSDGGVFDLSPTDAGPGSDMAFGSSDLAAPLFDLAQPKG